MKTYLFAAALLLSAGSSLAASPVTGLPPDIEVAVNALQKEYEARLYPAKGTPLRAEQPSPGGYSETQKAALRAVFGTEQALDIRRLPRQGRLQHYALRIPAHSYASNSSRSQWSELTLKLSVDAAGTIVNSSGAWPGITVQDQSFHLAISDLSLTTRQAMDTVTGLKLGAAQLGIARIAVKATAKADAIDLLAEHNAVQIAVARQGKKIEQKIDFSTRHLSIGSTRVDDLHLALRLRDLDASAMKQFEDSVLRLKQSTLPEPERSRAVFSAMTQLLKTQVLQGASLEITDLSAMYGGSRVQLKGSISLPGVSVTDLAIPEGIWHKLVARFELRLPLPVLRSIAHGTALIASKGEPNAAELESNLYQLFLGRALAEGYARLEREVLVSSIELRQGKLRTNGKEQPFSIDALLKKWPQNAAPPPTDASIPVEVTWRDRTLESLSLFAGNGAPEAIRELCRRQPDDAVDGERWCTRQTELLQRNPQALPIEHLPEAPQRTLQYRAAAGHNLRGYYRFDDSKQRRLDVTLVPLQTRDNWPPVLSVCLTAELPSDMACLALVRSAADSTQLEASTGLLSTDRKSRKMGQRLGPTFPIGEALQIQAWVRDGQAHFSVNGQELMQEVVFPVGLMQLSCANADCTYQFN